MALLNNVFGGSSDTMLQTIREVLQKHGSEDKEFPAEAINVAIARKGRSSAFDANSVERILSLTYHDSESFLALSLLYDENGWGTMAYQKDHIFPQAAFTIKSLKANGIDGARLAHYQERQHCLGNLNLMLASENQGKSDVQFEKWLESRDKTFNAKHLIPEDRTLYSLDRFEDFLEAREKLIGKRLESIFGSAKT